MEIGVREREKQVKEDRKINYNKRQNREELKTNDIDL